MNKKEKLLRLGKKCVDLAMKQGETREEFDNLFKDIYGIEFNWLFDGIIDALDYGMTDFSIERLEKEIIFKARNCNSEIDEKDVKNIKELSSKQEESNE
jgi:hypothetical protein